MAAFVAGGKRQRTKAAIVACLLATATARAGEDVRVDSGVGVRVYLPAAADVEAVRMALGGARRRLGGVSCQGLFVEFAGPDGRLLAAALAELGHTGASYLDLLSFYNGDGAAPCRSLLIPILAFTVPGSRVIHICPRFAGMQRRNSREAEATLIHEALHSLGLGENPPSSWHIQNRVLELCADANPAPSREAPASARLERSAER